ASTKPKPRTPQSPHIHESLQQRHATHSDAAPRNGILHSRHDIGLAITIHHPTSASTGPDILNLRRRRLRDLLSYSSPCLPPSKTQAKVKAKVHRDKHPSHSLRPRPPTAYGRIHTYWHTWMHVWNPPFEVSLGLLIGL
ncbi:hypothetical protein H0H93_006797, partial [Arthromyces matolae]